MSLVLTVLFTNVKCFEVFKWQSNEVLAILLSCKGAFSDFAKQFKTKKTSWGKTPDPHSPSSQLWKECFCTQPFLHWCSTLVYLFAICMSMGPLSCFAPSNGHYSSMKFAIFCFRFIFIDQLHFKKIYMLFSSTKLSFISTATENFCLLVV